MSTARSAIPSNASLIADEPDDLFIIAYDEYAAALDELDAAEKEVDRLCGILPDDARRPCCALIGVTTEDGKAVAVYAHTHEEIDEAVETMRRGSDGDPVSDTPIIEAFAAAAHEALRQDAERGIRAQNELGLPAARERYYVARSDVSVARDRMLTIVPISPEGITWLAQFVHSAANDGKDLGLAARAARNLALATSRKVFGRDLLPTLH
ncbi:hypothetical protein [Kaistia granuli]|uniref:hypothetical protein n=1 Tax=Kaistia granuli TaxID=363259 RepID=UPI00037DBDEC|nr:hypothetical protein [Kaistia granuli]